MLDCGVAGRECFAFENSLGLNCPAGTYALAAAAFALPLLQGADIYVAIGGEATLINTNVHENVAGRVYVSAFAFQAFPDRSSAALLE